MTENFIFTSPYELNSEDIVQIENSITNAEELNLFIGEVQTRIFTLVRLFRHYYPSAEEVINSPIFGMQNKILLNESKENLASEENAKLWDIVIVNQIVRMKIIKKKSEEFNLDYSDYFVNEAMTVLEAFRKRILMIKD